MRVSKYVNQTKVVNDLAFTTVSYLKGKVEVKAEGYQGSIWIGTQTWKNAKANVSKRSCFHIESKRFKSAFEKANSLLPVVYNPIRKNFLGITDKESLEYMGHCLMVESDDDKAIRRTYKQFAKLYHPDYLKRELFPDEIIVLEVLKETKEIALMNYRDMMEVLSDLED